MSILQEGGVLMYPLLITLLLTIFLIVKAFINSSNRAKNIELIKSISLFALVLGFLGQIIGLIGAFDQIESFGNVAPGIVAAGLKISFLSTGFGALIFLIGRIGIIGLIWSGKE